jgi:hypothetical protein
MASRHSGNDIVMVRVPGGTPEPRSNAALIVGDDAPWVELGFRAQLPQDLRIRLERDADGRLFRSSEQPDSTLNWMCWQLWDPEKAGKRRRGEFVIGGGNTGITQVRAYVEPERIFSAAEHQHMVDDIVQSLEGATWETGHGIAGVHVRKTSGNESVPQTIVNTRHELRDAQSIMRHPAVELAPARPGEKGLVGAPHLVYTTELPENHLVGWWATHRLRSLQSATIEIRAQLARQSSERAQINASLAKTREKDLSESVSKMETMLSELEELRRKLAFFARPELPNLRLVGPALTRDARRRRLLDALRRTVEFSTIEMSILLSRFRERTFDALFEVWGAVALVHVIQSMNWNMNEAPRLRWIDTWSPERITWSFTRGDERLDFIYEPHAERRQLAPQSAVGPFLDRMQRAAAAMDLSGEPRFIAVNAVASPDYALILHSRDGIAFTIGDAIATDFKYAKTEAKKGWAPVIDKMRKIANDYSRSVAWWSHNNLVTCSTPAAFVLVPGDDLRWLAESAITSELDTQNVVLVGAVPRVSQDDEPIYPGHIERIVDTLRAHAKDGSHLVPGMPGGALRGAT